MKEFKRVTLQDVAKEAKVSYASVSAVLNGKDGKSIRVAQKTKEKILECAAALGYVPNMAARKLKNGTNSLIAVFTYEQIFPVESENEYYRFFVGIQETAEKLGYDILILNNRPTEENSSRIVLADGAVMMGVNRDDKGIERLVKANYPLVFVGRREVSDVPTHWVTFDYQKVITQMVDHLFSLCTHGAFVYVESEEQEREPRKDKRRFLLEAALSLGLQVLIVQADERNIISEEAFRIIEQCKVVVFDRLFLLEPFEMLLERKNLKLGSDIRGVVLEDDWMGGHEHWTRWSNQRLELGSLSVQYLSRLLQKHSLEQFNTLTDLYLVISESSAFPEQVGVLQQ